MAWEKRNTVSRDRIDELTELYESLGFEVKVEPYSGPDNANEICDGCYADQAGEYFIIYTKKREEE